MTTDTKLNQLIINKLTQEQYDEAKAAGTLSDTELYITDSDDDALTNNNISNCITEIPQDIKLELNNGTLTLKAGSKVYIPNEFESDGVTKKFDVIVIESDKVCGGYNTGTCVVFTDYLGNLYANINISPYTGSGSSAPTDLLGLFYNTTTNTIGVRFDTSSQFTGRYSLPIAIVTNSSTSVCSSIDQVFNGFGYIGSTVFALPGVKGLIPNGRNAGSSLKSIEFKTERVLTYTFTTNWLPVNICGIALNSNQIAIHEFTYNSEMNKLDIDDYAWVGDIKLKNDGTSNINWIRPKTVFHALDYNDKSTISGWSMPSSRYIDLTLGASGSTYTAPANGYFQLAVMVGKMIQLYNNSKSDFWKASLSMDEAFAETIECQKGDKVQCYYIYTTFRWFRFYYAEGEN